MAGNAWPGHSSPDRLEGNAILDKAKYPVVSIIFAKRRCQVLNGRGKGKIYGYKPEWFVQKLDSERIVA